MLNLKPPCPRNAPDPRSVAHGRGAPPAEPRGATYVSARYSCTERTTIDPSPTADATRFIAEGGDGFTVLTQGTHRVLGPVDLEALTAHVGHTQGELVSAIEGRLLVAPKP